MSRGFRLAGLLRLRKMQQDAAAADLAAANHRVRDTSRKVVLARTELGETTSEIADPAVLHAVAAARASTSSMLADLAALGQQQQQDAAAAQSSFHEARAAAVRLEKLEERHDEQTAASDLAAEQNVLDDVAARGWHARQRVQAGR